MGREGAFQKYSLITLPEQMELPDKAPAPGLGFALAVGALRMFGCSGFRCTWMFSQHLRSPVSVKGVSGIGHSCAEEEGEKT